MRHLNYEEFFPLHIWQRGVLYYENGHVLSVKHLGNKIFAEVKGTKIYRVSVSLDSKYGQIENYSCECPYGEDGTPCKHLAAVLCALEERDEEPPVFENTAQEIEKLVSLLSEQQMRELLIHFSQYDPYAFEKIRLEAQGKLPKSYMEQWEQDLHDITRSKSDRHGFINYENAWDYCCMLSEYLEDRVPDLLSNELFMETIELSCRVFQTGICQELDDSDGGLSVLAHSCMDVWTKILLYSDYNTHLEFFHQLTSQYSDNEIAEMFLDEFMFDAPWEYELGPLLFNFIDKQLQRSSLDPANEYRFSKFVLSKLNLMERFVVDTQKINSFIIQNRQLPDIRERLISRAIQNKEYDAALALLEESIELDKDKQGLLYRYSTQKIEIFEKINDITALKNELKSFVLSFRQDSLDYILKLKTLLTASEWQELLPKLLVSSSMYSQAYQLMIQEKMYERLIEEIEKHNDVYSLECYWELLTSKFPLRCKEIYINYIQYAMYTASNRKAYRAVIKKLNNLYILPDGKTCAKKIANAWKLEYNRRSSMIDELNKAGF